MQNRNTTESAVDCLEATFTECHSNQFVSRCDGSERCGDPPSKSHGVSSSSAHTGHNHSNINDVTINPKSIQNANAIVNANIIHGASPFGLRRKPKPCVRYNPSAPDKKCKATSSPKK